MRTIVLAILACASALAADTCVECHSVLEGPLQKPAALFPKQDVHARHNFTCVDCHGGDPTQTDPDASMNKAKGFKRGLNRTSIPALCAKCHSDANLMHKFAPQQRVDQYAQYQTSVHGKLLAKGDDTVATCVDCHSVHDIREVKDGNSPVHPLRLPETCARCHSDAELMTKHKIKSDQFAEYRTSVHWEALAKRGDLSAPSCASCHGNHGATPPAVSSVAAVCGTCHVLYENLYNKSPHQPVFSSMGAGGCTVCHGAHAIQHPGPSMLAGENAVCAQCHDAASNGGAEAIKMAVAIDKLSAELERAGGLLEKARSAGMEVSEAQMKHGEGKEALLKARVAVHAFRAAPVENAANAGMAIAAETLKAGEQALKERDSRRVGLALSLITILITLAGLWMAIRVKDSQGEAAGPARR